MKKSKNPSNQKTKKAQKQKALKPFANQHRTGPWHYLFKKKKKKKKKKVTDHATG